MMFALLEDKRRTMKSTCFHVENVLPLLFKWGQDGQSMNVFWSAWDKLYTRDKDNVTKKRQEQSHAGFHSSLTC